MLRQGRRSAEAVAALVTLYLHLAVGVHAPMAAQVGELGVRLEAHLALERLHRRVDVRVLFQTGRGGERLATLWTRVTAGSHVVRPDVALKVRRVGKNLRAIGRKEKGSESISLMSNK